MADVSAAPDLFRRALLLGIAGVASGCNRAGGALPQVALPPIAGLLSPGGWALPGFDAATLKGQVTLLNIWASWCPYCRAEHDMLKRVAADGRFRLVGLVHNDTADKARDYLRQAGNPYASLSVDAGGRIGAALGQRGVPNSFVIDRDLKSVQSLVGELTDRTFASVIMPAVMKARAG